MADTEIRYHGSMITLPDDPTKMELETAVDVLNRKIKAENKIINVNQRIECFWTDGLYALHMAMKETFGWVEQQDEKFLWFTVPPQMINVRISTTETMDLPYGAFGLPGIEGKVHVQPEAGIGVYVRGELKKKDAEVIKKICNLAKEYLKENSIYKGKALRLTEDIPDFITTSNVPIILNTLETSVVETALWAPIRFTERCISNKIPLKRGILLEGPYGCGKTLIGTATAKVCEEHGWTYLLLEDTSKLKEALELARRYQPAVVFAEDIDRNVKDRTNVANDILNTVDGVLSKNSQVIVVLTTNHPERIEKAMLRPGRLDAVVSVRPPEPEQVIRLIQLYGGKLISKNEDLTEVGETLKGQIPATIREVVERSKLAMISRDDNKVTAMDLVVTAHGMQAHLALMQDTLPPESPEETFGRAMLAVLHKANESKGEMTLLKLLAIDHGINIPKSLQ